ncbi:MAG: hypothetical protein M1829_000529 [Trizodia sp. TS-e1964]|nr:MAG: hypothetical protein M1829_000529 [Trizodia sp. TS-e1964]
MPTQESPAKRSPASAAQRSSSSSLSRNGHRSPSPGAPTSPLNPPKNTHSKRQHHVGNNRNLHNRVPSHGKGLNKLTKLNQVDEAGPVSSTKTHRRSRSHTPSTSPSGRIAPQDGSSISLAGEVSKVLVKNKSSSSLKRNGSIAQALKSARRDGPNRRPQSQPGRANRAATTVHFDLGDEDRDDGWTETSNSESPNLTRTTNSRPCSSGHQSPTQAKRASFPLPEADAFQNSPPQSPPEGITVEPTYQRQNDKGNSQHRLTSDAPDAEVITSRLLLRHSRLNAPPQMSSISATAMAGPALLDIANSQSPTLNGTPVRGDEIISRFIRTGTSGGGSFPAGRLEPSPRNNAPNEKDKQKADNPSPQVNQTPSTPPTPPVPAPPQTSVPERPISGSRAARPTWNTIPSRTQQKLWLQRASTNMETHQQQQRLPGSTGLGGRYIGSNGIIGMGGGIGVGAGGSGGRRSGDSRLQQQEIERAKQEYLVLRRSQNPLGDALERLKHLPWANKRRHIPSSVTSNARNSSREDSLMASEMGKRGIIGSSQGSLDTTNRDGPREGNSTPRTNGASKATLNKASTQDKNKRPARPKDDQVLDRESGRSSRRDRNGNSDEEEGEPVDDSGISEVERLLRRMWEGGGDSVGQD